MKTSLKELLMVMRHLHNASLDANWDRVEVLDNQRREMLGNLSNTRASNVEKNRIIIQELLELDQAVLALIKQEREFEASQVATTHAQNRVHEFYQQSSTAR